MSIESVMPSCPLSTLLLLPSNFPSSRVFSNESSLCIRRPKSWSFSTSPSNEYWGLISFRIDWFDLAVQGTVKSLLQHHSSKALYPTKNPIIQEENTENLKKYFQKYFNIELAKKFIWIFPLWKYLNKLFGQSNTGFLVHTWYGSMITFGLKGMKQTLTRKASPGGW